MWLASAELTLAEIIQPAKIAEDDRFKTRRDVIAEGPQ
jgi:hypothetical protein